MTETEIKKISAIVKEAVEQEGARLEKRFEERLATVNKSGSVGASPALIKDLAAAVAEVLKTRIIPRLNKLEEANETFTYEGPFDPAKSYVKGNFASHGGSMWYCERATRQRPGDGPDWVLAVKHGRDAR